MIILSNKYLCHMLFKKRKLLKSLKNVNSFILKLILELKIKMTNWVVLTRFSLCYVRNKIFKV